MPIRILVVGDIAWDILLSPCSELVWGSDVYGTVDMLAGGAAANVAVWARRLGVAATLAGKIGDDVLGELMVRHLETEGVDSRLITVPGGITTRVGIVLSLGGEHAFVTDHERALRFAPGDLEPSLLEGADLFFFNGYSVFMSESAKFVAPLLAEARRRRTPIAFDASSFALVGNYGARHLLDEIGPLDVLFANEEEAQALAGDDTLDSLLARTRLLVVKRGEDGAFALDASGATSAPAVPVAVVDTTGAGDAFDAAFLVEYLTGRDVPRALEAGNRLGARVAAQVGAQPRADIPPSIAAGT